MDNTVTGAMPPGAAPSQGTADADLEAACVRNVKRKWVALSSATALVVAVGVALEQVAKVSETIFDLTKKALPKASVWTEDQHVVIVRQETLGKRTIKICFGNRELGDTLHIALVLGNDRGSLLPAFILVKSGCAKEKGLVRVQMNSEDFDKYITEPRTADFELSYYRAHLHALDLLVEDAVEDALDQCKVEVASNETLRGN